MSNGQVLGVRKLILSIVLVIVPAILVLLGKKFGENYTVLFDKYLSYLKFITVVVISGYAAEYVKGTVSAVGTILEKNNAKRNGQKEK